MDEYTIFCTEGQTKKALELGAPIRRILPTEAINDPSFEMSEHFSDRPIPYFVKIPTTEQMIGWLEEPGITEIFITRRNIYYWNYLIICKKKVAFRYNSYPNRKEATLAAIDAALEYLINK